MLPTREQYRDFDSLPVLKDGPPGNAWGIWGPDDQLGTLNLLTPETIAKAASENIRTGERVSLNWSMTAAANPQFIRKTLKLELINKAPLKHAHDDVWTFNSQCSSQWDGLRHYAYQESGLYYMGRKAEDFAASPIPNGIQHVSEKGISGRAILIDWYAWALKQNMQVDAMAAYAIPFDQLVAALEFQGLSIDSFLPGDILVVRFGYLSQYKTMDNAKRSKLNELYKTEKPDNIGVSPSEDLMRFLWEKKIAAVCGDSRTFEVWPCTELQWHMHEWLLAGWGMPIGELFDLEALSHMCHSSERYTFFLSTSPMNVPGAVASPPNAIAFF